MAKSNKSSQIFSFCAIALGALGLIFWLFLAAASRTETVLGVTGKASATGMAMIFGGNAKVSLGGTTTTVEAFNFSFPLFIGFIAAIAGLVITILPLCGVKFKLFPIIALACFVVAALFCFLSKTCANTKSGYSLDEIKLGIGAILGGICFICAACASALPIVFKK